MVAQVGEAAAVVLAETLSEEFPAVGPAAVGSVDWSYNVTYRTVTHKVRVAAVTNDTVELYVLGTAPAAT